MANRRKSNDAAALGDATPRVAIVLFAGVIAHDMLGGIARYVRSHRPWHVLLAMGDAQKPTPALLGWVGDGLIAHMRGPEMQKWAAACAVPSVTTHALNGDRNVTFPSIDKVDEARQAADHFFSRGLRQFAFCPNADGLDWGRQQPFVEAVAALGGHCHIYASAPALLEGPWEAQFDDLCQWLKRLPKPIGIFAANDERGYQLIDGCRQVGLRVPDDMAVLGDDNDQAVCDLCNPPLSSIQRPHEELGYQCAALLDALMLGQPILPLPMLPAVRLVPRQSTDVLAVDDPEVASALRFIYQNLHRQFNVKDLLQEIPIGRRALEQRFHRAIGRTLGREINRMRVARAVQLLSDTQLPMTDVADRCGYGNASRLSEAFRRELGKTPSSFRIRHG